MSSCFEFQPYGLCASSNLSFDFVKQNSFKKLNDRKKFEFSKKQQPNDVEQLSPSQRLRSKFAKYNNELLLPRCLQKSLTKKFTLSPLSIKGRKSQSAFKLKNYCRFQDKNFDTPVQYDEGQTKKSKPQQKAQTSKYLRLTFLRQNDNKENKPYQSEFAEMLITKSKLKYSPRQTMNDNKTKWVDHKIGKENESQMSSFLNKTSSALNFTTFSRRTQGQWNQPKELLNSTRSKLLQKIDNVNQAKITKIDLFPLEKLLQKRSQKFNFRNKWFNKIIQSESKN